jgi:hypothetical protein
VEAFPSQGQGDQSDDVRQGFGDLDWEAVALQPETEAFGESEEGTGAEDPRWMGTSQHHRHHRDPSST